MSRGRPSGPTKLSEMSDNERVMTQVWHGLVDTLRLLPTVSSTSTKPTTDEERISQLKQVTSEKATLDEALEKLSTLIALRKGDSSSAGPPNLSVSTPNAGTPGSTAGGGGVKRKRRPSYSASPAPAMTPGPSSQGHLGAASGSNKKPNNTSTGLGTNGTDQLLSPKPAVSGTASARGNTPMQKDGSSSGVAGSGSGKAKKDMYADQMPLQPGRKIAFKRPAGPDVGPEEWILAIISRCLERDKTKYEVQDADDSTSRWLTKIGSIIPLPDPTSPPHLSSHPSQLEDFPKGSTVLGLYPDTTTFYKATVVAAPVPGSGNGLGVKGGNGKADPGAKREKYRLAFVDDGDNVHEVHKDYVVLYPT